MKVKLVVIIFLFMLSNHARSQDAVQPAFELLSEYPNVRDFALTADQEEAYFTMQSMVGDVSVIVSMRNEDGQWQKPAITSFSGKYSDLEPYLSPDGLKLYFASNRPLADSLDSPKDYDIWYVERKTIRSAWGEPINVGGLVNSAADEFYPSVTISNNLYFTSNGSGTKGKDDIFFSEWKNGAYSEPVSLPEAVNSDGYEFNAYISPDESYLIFSGYNREDGRGSGDMYISFLNENKQWETAVNLGDQVNSKYMDYCPFVDANNQTLYFTSKRSTASKVNRFASLEQFISEIHKYENGLSRIYKVSIKNLLNP